MGVGCTWKTCRRVAGNFWEGSTPSIEIVYGKNEPHFVKSWKQVREDGDEESDDDGDDDEQVKSWKQVRKDGDEESDDDGDDDEQVKSWKQRKDGDEESDDDGDDDSDDDEQTTVEGKTVLASAGLVSLPLNT
ncbi:uncharacterized protein LOC131876620 [Cryptomeria japonica]|uniref:uncharacterized protein LOC131876620 n=1 Tax=Cryptomeria japonica TaxID=3369 RepID=UPI0027D9D8EA|nr:uncharacterized protein LOC131876620 [Cryptomeria japonica]